MTTHNAWYPDINAPSLFADMPPWFVRLLLSLWGLLKLAPHRLDPEIPPVIANIDTSIWAIQDEYHRYVFSDVGC